MAIRGDNLSSYMIRPTEWSDTIIRVRATAPGQARVRVHASLFCLRQGFSAIPTEFQIASEEASW